jgi:hypothetical protein
MVLTDGFPCMILHRRNLSCIGCGCPRAGVPSPTPIYQSGTPPTRLISSPRFVTSPGFPTYFPQPQLSPPQPSTPFISPSQQFPAPPTSLPSKGLSPSHPLLTPSGRAFAVGGKVQNVSKDPLTPCVMYWPDNEAIPEQGQIRPSGLSGVPVSSVFGLPRYHP